MKWFVFLLAFWSASVLAQVQTGAEPGTKQGFSPRYFKTLPATQVDSLWEIMRVQGGYQAEVWQNDGYNFWLINPSKQPANLLLIQAVCDEENYVVFTKSEFTDYFGLSVRFDPWSLAVKYQEALPAAVKDKNKTAPRK